MRKESLLLVQPSEVARRGQREGTSELEAEISPAAAKLTQRPKGAVDAERVIARSAQPAEETQTIASGVREDF